MSNYGAKVLRQRKLLGILKKNWNRYSQEEYDKVTLELVEETRMLMEKGINPYDYAPDPVYEN